MAHNVLPIRGDRFDGAELDETASSQFARRVERVLSDRFEVGDVIGVGSMGVVFRGVQRTTKRAVAIKVASPLLAPDQRVRFRREAELGRRFVHANCVSVEEYAIADGDLEYMILSLVEGKPLSELLGEKLPLEQGVDWTMQILRGVEHVHQQGIVHRDLKPANILVERDARGKSTLRIADYGIAKPMLRDDSVAIDCLSRETMTGLMAGTPAYMAPEQAMALGCDRRSDLYSVGLVAYEILTGALPRPEDDAFDQMRARLTEDVSLLLSYVPAPVAMIVGKLLRARPEERYATAQEALEDLSAFVAGQSLPHAGRDALAPPPVAASMERSGTFRATRMPANDAVTAVEVVELAPPRRRGGVLMVAGLVVCAGLGGLWLGGVLLPARAADAAPRPSIIEPGVAAPVEAAVAAPEPRVLAPSSTAVADPPEPPVVKPTRTADKRAPSKRRKAKSKPDKPAATASTPAPTVPRAPLLRDDLRKPSGI